LVLQIIFTEKINVWRKMMRKIIIMISCAALIVCAVSGCKSGSADEECEPGATQSCLCEGEMLAVGIQTCDEDGKWSECECGAGGTDASAGDSDSDTDGDTDPFAVINANPTIGTAPLEVDFSATVLDGEEPYAYAWDFGDGNTSAEQSPANTYTSAGTYNVILTVTDADGDTTAYEKEIHVAGDTEPAVEITADPATGVEPLTVILGASVVGGNEPFTYEWDFDDDGTADANGMSSMQVFNEGSHTISLTVTDADGDSASDSMDIEVTDRPEKPEAVATASADCVLDNNRPVQLDGAGSSDPNGDALTYNWVFVSKPAESEAEFDDATIENPTFEPDTEGVYDVQLFVFDGTHRSGSDILTITVSSTPGTMEKVSGDGQRARAFGFFNDAFKIRILNECGIPLPGAMVYFSGLNAHVPGSADCDMYYCTTTDMNGELSFPVKAGFRAGIDGKIIAQSGCTSVAFTDLTVRPSTADGLVMMPVNTTQPADGVSSIKVDFQLMDHYLNPVDGPDVQFGLRMDWGSHIKGFENDPDNTARFLDAGVNGFCENSNCTNLETVNGKRSVNVSATTTWPVFVEVYDVSVIEDDSSGLNIGDQLRGFAMRTFDDDFEGSGDLDYNFFPWSQWEIGEPTSADGPASAHSGDNVLGTNLSGDFEIVTGPPAGMDIDTDIDFDTDLDFDKDPDKGYMDFIFSDFANIEMEYPEHRFARGFMLEFWHWYDMTGGACVECTSATGNIVYYTDEYEYMNPMGRHPLPHLCLDPEDPVYMGWDVIAGFGGKSDGWENVAMRPWMFNDKEPLPPLDDALNFALHTSTFGDNTGPGWYIDDIHIKVLLKYGSLQFANTGIGAYTEVWREPGMDYNGIFPPDAGPCMDYADPANVHAVVYDEHDNRIMEPGIQVEFTLADAGLGKGAGTGVISEVLRGSLVSQTGGVTTVETDYDGVIRLSILDSVPGTNYVRSQLSGVSGSQDDEAVVFTQEAFPTGDCCEDPIIMNSGNPGTDFSTQTPTYLYNYHSIVGSCYTWNFPMPDAVFKFKVSEDGLYYVRGNSGSYNYEIRMGDNCPGTRLVDDVVGSACFGYDTYAYLYEGETYWVIVQNYGHDSGDYVTIYVQRQHSGGE